MARGHQDKIAVITGAATGLGQAYARRLAEDGCHIVAADLQPGDETVRLVREAGREALAVRCDVSSPEDVARLAGAVEARFGRCDILVNNAGIYPHQDFADITHADWRRVMAVNLDGMFFTAKAFVPGMRRRGWGRIVNIASNTFGTPVTGVVHYVASKGGVIGFTRALASEVAPHGITVNAIAPGLTKSSGTTETYPLPEARWAMVANAQAIKRTQLPPDLVGALSFLTSDDSAFITGQTLYVDGGWVKELSMPDAMTDGPSLVAKARALAPLLAKNGAANAAAGRLADETVAALYEAGFFGLLVPRCFGGYEADPFTALQVIEAISAADGSSGWVLMACNVGTGSAAGYLPPAGAAAVFGKRIPIIAGEGAPKGRADVEGKGFRLTGRWSYGSGVLHTEWLHTGGMVYENGQPRETRTFIVPTREAKFLGNWDVLGLNGTGSIDYGLDGVYVPEEFTHSPNLLVGEQGGSLYRLGIVGMSPLGHTGFTLGLGRRILDELNALVAAPAGRPSPLAELGGGQSFQEDFAAAEAKFRAGRAFCYEVWSDVAATLARDAPCSARQFTLMRLALSHVTTAVAEVATFAHRAGGGVALRSGILQRSFRDMFAATQHRIVSPYMLRECGRELLGLAKDKVWATRGLVDPG